MLDQSLPGGSRVPRSVAVFEWLWQHVFSLIIQSAGVGIKQELGSGAESVACHCSEEYTDC